MATYSTLKATVLTLLDLTGSTDAGTVVETALIETLKYIAARASLPQLIGSATATWGSATTSVPIGTSGDPKFNLSDFGTPNRLYVKKDSSVVGAGIPYTYVEYLDFLDLQNVPYGDVRDSLYEPASIDARPHYAWTIDHSTSPGAVIPYPISENNVLTLYYNKAPAAYNASNSPEIDALWDRLLTEGAFMITDQWLKEPEKPLPPHLLLARLNPEIDEYKLAKRSNRKRSHVRISNRYSIYPDRR